MGRITDLLDSGKMFSDLGVPNINPFHLRPSLTNGKLFDRDRNVCAYCGGHFHESDLTREHIIPQALGAPRPLMGAA